MTTQATLAGETRHREAMLRIDAAGVAPVKTPVPNLGKAGSQRPAPFL